MRLTNHRHAARGRVAQRPRVALFAIGIVLTLAATGILVSLHLTSARVDSRAHQLVATARGVAASATARPKICDQAGQVSKWLGKGLVLTIPSIELTAPVLPGTSTTALASAVGHLSTSKWPQQGGTDVLESHDVTFFTHLDRAPVGADVILNGPCRRWTYRIESKRVVQRGTPIRNDPSPTLVLITCWPLNALFVTPQRYVVTAALSSTAPTVSPVQPASAFTYPKPTVPAGLSQEKTREVAAKTQFWTLTVSPFLGTAFAQSSEALRSGQSAAATFDAAVLALRDANPAWWHAVAPGLAPPSRTDANIVSRPWMSHVFIAVGGHEGRVTTARITTTIPTLAGLRRLTVSEGVVDGYLVVTAWRVS